MYQIAFLFLALIMATAQGQVIKCINPSTGHATYSDRQCDSGQVGKLVERQRTTEEVQLERMQAAAANERKAGQLKDEALRQARTPQAQAPAERAPAADKSSSYECRQARKEQETVASIQAGTPESRRSRINDSIIKTNMACGTTTELMQAPARAPFINNPAPTGVPKEVRCNGGACYDNQGGVYHQQGPDFMTGPGGQACFKQGPRWNCN